MVFIGTSLKSVIKYFKRKGKIISSIPSDAENVFAVIRLKQNFGSVYGFLAADHVLTSAKGKKKYLN